MSKINLRDKLGTNSVPEQAAADRQSPEPDDLPERSIEELVRKETRLWPEQLTELAQLRRRLNAERNAREKSLEPAQRSASVTDQALTRAAITLLLENADAISGWTEQDVLESLRKATKRRAAPKR